LLRASENCAKWAWLEHFPIGESTTKKNLPDFWRRNLQESLMIGGTKGFPVDFPKTISPLIGAT
jgi:hypothetical protein